MAAHGRDASRLQTGSAAANDDNLSLLGSGCELRLPERLVAGSGIHGAGGFSDGRAAVDSLSDATVATDAAAHFDHAAVAGLVCEFRVGDSGAGHAHKVAEAPGKKVFGDYRIVDAAGEQHRDWRDINARAPGHFTELGRVVEGRLDVGGNAPRVADVEVKEVQKAGFGDAGDHLAHFQHAVAAGTRLHAVHPDTERHAVADALAHAIEDLDDEPDASPGIAPPPVGALVGGGHRKVWGRVSWAQWNSMPSRRLP